MKMLIHPTLVASRAVRARLGRSAAQSTLAMVALAWTAWLSGCSADIPVIAPCDRSDGYYECPDSGAVDVAVDISGDASTATDTTVPKPIVKFYVETATGNTLEGNVTSAKITNAADNDVAVGTQVTVVVKPEQAQEGAEVLLTIGTTPVGPKALVGGEVRFEHVTIPCGKDGVNLQVTVTSGGQTDKAGKTLLLDCGSPCTATIQALASPCLTTDGDAAQPGFQYTFTVQTTTPECSDAHLEFVDAEGKKQSPAEAVQNSSVIPIKASLSSKDNGFSGTKITVIAVVEDKLHPERGSEPSQPVTVTLSTEEPVIAVTAPLAQAITLTDDLDPKTDGIQVLLTGTVTGLGVGDQLEVSIDGGVAQKTTPQADGSFQLPLTFSATKSYAVSIKATPSCGKSASKVLQIKVFADKATLSVSSPVAKTLLAKDDGNVKTQSVYETQFTVDVQQGTQDAEVSVFCRKAGLGNTYPAAPMGKATITGAGAIQVPVAIDTSLTGSSVVCYATDGFGDFAAPNPALSDEVTLTVALPAPCLSVALPAGEVTVTTHELQVSLADSNLTGQAVSVVITSDQGVANDPQVVGKLSAVGLAAKVPLAAGGNLPDGTYVLAFDAVDGFGNKASDSAAVGICGDVTRVIHIDTTGPAIAFSLPSKATLTTFEDVDTDVAAPGYQTDVGLAIADAVQVCVETSAGQKTCVPTLASDTAVKFPNVTLQPGVNTLSATATDAAGNTTSAAPLVVTLVSDAPVVQFTSPTGNVTTTQDAVTFTAKVSQVGGAPVSTAVTEVLIDGAAATVTVTEVNPGEYSFTVTGLSAKATTTVQFGAAAVGAEDKKGFSVAVTVTYKSAKPAIQITAPTNSQVFNLSSKECAVGAQSCDTTVTASVSDVETGSTATLTVNCGGAVQTYTAKSNGAALSFANVSLADQQTCDLSAQVTDVAGQVALSADVTVAVDRIAPKFAQISQPSIKQTDAPVIFVAAEDINGDPSDGVQTNLQILLYGVPEGAVATLVVTDDNGVSSAPYTGKAGPGATDFKAISVGFGLVSLPSGDKVHLVFTVSDAAGNKTILDVTAEVKASKPEVQIGEPLNVQEDAACTTSATCGGNLCYLGKCTAFWNLNSIRKVTVSVAGLPKNGKVALCSNSAAVSGPACATGGFKEVATTTAATALVTFVLPNTLPDGAYVFIAEASALPLVPVTASLKAQAVQAQKRTVLIDTVAPSVTSFQAPAAPGASQPCLNEASQSVSDGGVSGGSFTFVVATNEPSIVTVTGNGTKLAAGPTTATPSNLTVTLASDGTQVFEATATDAVGNKSTISGLPPVLVDTIKPTGGFGSPAAPKVIVGSLLDVVVTSTALDVEGAPVAIKDSAVAKGSEPMSGGQALFPDGKYKLLSQGDHTLTADLTDKCGNTAVFGTTPSKVTVDLLPPTLSFSAPAQGALFGDKDDAAPSTGGYQVATTFSTTDAATWKVELGSGCDASFANCTAGFQTVGSGNVTAPGGAEPPVLMTIPFGNGDNYAVRVTGTDVNGNVTTIERGFKVVLSGCLVSLQGLSGTGIYNNQSCATAGTDCASVTVNVTATFFGPCGTVANLQLKKGATQVGLKVPGGDAKAVFAVTVADGDNTTLEALALDGASKAVGSSGALALKADLTSPKVNFVAGSVLGVPTPAGGKTNLVGKAKDLGASAGHQIHLELTVNDVGLIGGKLAKVENTVGATTGNLAFSSPSSLPITFTTAPAGLVDFQFATLTEDATNTVTATVSDAAGNVTTASVVVVVDWTAPAKVSLADFTAADLNARRPLAKLNFTAPGDNGTNGTAASYAVRYSKKPINTQADFDAACDASKLTFATIGKPKAAGQAEALFVEGPDERDLADPCKFTPLIDSGASAWYFAVETSDAAGNVSALSNTLSTTALRLQYASIVPGGALKTTDMQQRVAAVGDLNGDGLGDFALGGGTSSPLCIVYGRVNLNLSSIDLSVANAYPSHVCLTNTGGLGAPVGRSGDVNGDGVSDLVVGVGSGTGSPRFVHVYLGAKNAAIGTSPAVIVKNITSPGADGVWKASAIGNFSGTKSAAGKPLADIAVTCRSSVLPYDRVLVIPGSETLSAATPRTVDIDSPTDRAKYNVGTIRVVDSSGAPAFGSSLFNVGNMLVDSGATQYDDLAISQGSVYQAVWVIKGRPLVGDVDIGVSKTATTGPEDKNAVQIQASGTVAISLFGLHMDVVNLDNDALPDLVIQHASSTATGGGGLYWLHGSVLAGNLGKIVSLASETAVPGNANLFAVQGGYRIRDYHFAPQSVGNFADRPVGASKILDVVHGRPTYATDGANNRVIVRLGFARPSSPIPGEASFAYSDMAIYDPANNAATGWGIVAVGTSGPVSFAPIGDFNGDGISDLVIGSSAGSLIIVY